jgi:hypothetical protein
MHELLSARGAFELSPSGLTFTGELSAEEWRSLGGMLGKASRAVQWAVGDWLAYGEHRWGEMYDEAERLTGLDAGTLRNWKSIAARFDLSRRRDKLPFTAHAEVAALPPKEADRLLSKAEKEGLSTRAVREAARARKSADAPADSQEPFLFLKEAASLRATFKAWREEWPGEHRPQFFAFVRSILQNLEDEVHANDGGEGAGRPESRYGAAG